MSQSDSPDSKTSPSTAWPWKRTLAICVGLIALAVAASVIIRSTEPEAERSAATKRTAMLVETTTVERGTFRPRIVVLGVVRAQEDILLSPRVAGEVIERSSSFEVGRFVEAGEWLLRLDPADYANVVAQRESALHQAEANLQLERGRQRVAELDFELVEGEVTADSRSLVLREPQLNAARAAVEAAEALLEQAHLDLGRTHVRAPFDAQVLSREVAVGSQVAAGAPLGRLVGMEAYWVTASVPVDKLRALEFADGGTGTGSRARLRHRAAWAPGEYREGRVEHLIGTLDEGTRLARINLSVPDPLARDPAHAGLPPLILGALVEVTIEGAPIEDVIRLDRAYLRENDTVWVNDGGALRLQPVTVRFRDAQSVYLSDGLAEGAEIVTSSLSSVVEGAALRTAATPPEDAP